MPALFLDRWGEVKQFGRPVPQCRLEQLRARYPRTVPRESLLKAG